MLVTTEDNLHPYIAVRVTVSFHYAMGIMSPVSVVILPSLTHKLIAT
jgi:S-adenosylmethionine synthetase